MSKLYLYFNGQRNYSSFAITVGRNFDDVRIMETPLYSIYLMGDNMYQLNRTGGLINQLNTSQSSSCLETLKNGTIFVLQSWPNTMLLAYDLSLNLLSSNKISLLPYTFGTISKLRYNPYNQLFYIINGLINMLNSFTESLEVVETLSFNSIGYQIGPAVAFYKNKNGTQLMFVFYKKF